MAVGLICYSRLFRSNGSRLSLSRGIAHRSFVLLIVGGYLIILGVLGEGVRYLNLDNTRPVLYALMLVGGLGLTILFLSEKLRRRFKVTLHKNFYQSKYDYQQQWEMFTKRVSANKTLKEIQPAILDLFAKTWPARVVLFIFRMLNLTITCSVQRSISVAIGDLFRRQIR